MVYQPIPPRGLTTAAPYSYREGLTFQQKLERILAMLQTVIFDNGALAESYNTIIKEANESIQTALDTLTGLSDRYDDQLSEMDSKFRKQIMDVDEKLIDLDSAIAEAKNANQISSDLAESFNGLVESFRADLVAYASRITNLEDTTVKKNWWLYNVKDFGAVGDNQTDDTEAIKACSAAAGVGGIVVFPKGAYVISSKISPPLDQKWVAGGSGLDNPTPGTVIRSTVLDGEVVYCYSTQFDGIRFAGPGAEHLSSKAVSVKGAGYFANCTFQDFGEAFYANQTWYLNIINCYFRYNGVGMRFDYCYNVNIFFPRMHCRKRDNNWGVAIDMDATSMVTIHGGSLEQYTVGVKVNSNGAYTSFGTYYESSYPGAIGIRLEGDNSVVGVYGSQVYLLKHKAFVEASPGDAGNSIVGIGNKFKGAENQADTAYAYFWGSGNTRNLCVTLLGDSWGQVTANGFKYLNTEPINNSGSIIQYPNGARPDGVGGGKILANGMFENQKEFVLSHGGLPGKAPLGAMVYDPQTGKPMFGDGTRWRDAMGN